MQNFSFSQFLQSFKGIQFAHIEHHRQSLHPLFYLNSFSFVLFVLVNFLLQTIEMPTDSMV